MRKSVLNRFFLIAICLGIVGCTETKQAVESIKIGESFPDLALVSLESESRRLSDYRGKLVLLNIWATWCGPCRKELPSLDSLAKLLGEGKFAVLGLSIDDDKLLVREYLSDKDIHLPIYFMQEGQLDYAALGIKVFPYTFVILPDGRLAEVHAGERVWNTAQSVASLRRLIERG